ncbi:MAG: PIN domain-containing protein [Thermoleophilaceae bacterium]
MENSAWARLGSPGLAPGRTGEVADALEAGRIAVSAPFLLEAGYSARDSREHEELLAELLTLPLVSLDAEVEERALDGQSQLARAGHHRLPPVDLLQAALADRHGLGILHYDGDYDVIAERTDLAFTSVWLAARGSL